MSDDTNTTPNSNSDKDPNIQFSADDLAGWGPRDGQLFVKIDDADGANLEFLPSGERLLVTTENRKSYFIKKQEDGLYISGSSKRYSTPVKLTSVGSRGVEGKITSSFIRKGSPMEFSLRSLPLGKDTTPGGPMIVISENIISIARAPKEDQ